MGKDLVQVIVNLTPCSSPENQNQVECPAEEMEAEKDFFIQRN